MYGNNFMPFVVTDSIAIEQRNLEVKCSIRSRQTDEVPFWMKEDVVSSYVKIIFFVLYDQPVITYRTSNGQNITIGELPKIDSSILSSSKNRIKNIHLARLRNTKLENWTSVVTENFPHKIISLKEIKEYSEDNITTTSVLDLDSENLSDMFFSFDIDITQVKIRPDQMKSSKVELVGFSYLDIQGLKEDFGSSFGWGTSAEMLENGGNLSYSLLLDTDENGKTFIPETKTILTTGDGTPYLGDYHYHGPNNEGPGGYIGYMGGPADHPDMASMPRLTAVEVPNNKITSRLFLSEPQSTGYYGASTINLLEDEGDLLMAAYPNSGVYRTSKLSLGEHELNLRAGASLIMKSFFENPKNQPARKMFEDATSWIKTHSPDSDLEGYQATSFRARFDKIMRTQSKYGFFLEMLKKNGPIMLDGNNMVTDMSVMSQCKILSLSAYRKRLTNHPTENNPVGVAVYGDFDTNQIRRFMGTASDINSGRFKKALKYSIHPEPKWYKRAKQGDPSNILGIAPTLGSETTSHVRPIATICEIPIQDAFDEVSRTFEIRDYELYRDINFGNYTYSIKMSIEDNIKRTLIQMVTEFQKYIKEYKKFLNFASRPFNPEFQNRIDRGEGQNITQLDLGSYDLRTEKYTNSFIEYAEREFEPDIERLIKRYTAMARLLAGHSQIQVSGHIAKSIKPSQKGGLIEAQAFLVNCNNLLSLYVGLINRDKKQSMTVSTSSTIDNVLLSDYQYSTVHASPTDKAPDILYIEEDLDVVMESFVDGAIMASYDVEDEFINALQAITSQREQRQQDLEEIEEFEELEDEGISPRDTLDSLISKAITSIVDVTSHSDQSKVDALRADDDLAMLKRAMSALPPPPPRSAPSPFQNALPLTKSPIRSFVSPLHLLTRPAEALQERRIPITVKPSAIIASVKSKIKTVVTLGEYDSLPRKEKAISNVMTNQLIKTAPSKTKDQISKKAISLHQIPAKSGTSIGMPKLKSVTSALKSKNVSTAKSKNVKSAGSSEYETKSLVGADISKKAKDNLSYEKQKLMNMKEDEKVFSKQSKSQKQNKKTGIVQKVLSVVSASSKFEKKPKDKKSKFTKAKKGVIQEPIEKLKNYAPPIRSDYDLFEEKAATMDVSGGFLSKAKLKKKSNFRPAPLAKADTKIDAIEDVVMVKAKPIKKDKDIIATNNVGFMKVKDIVRGKQAKQVEGLTSRSRMSTSRKKNIKERTNRLGPSPSKPKPRTPFKGPGGKY